MYSTVDDLLRWDEAWRGNKILSEESKRRMMTPGLGNYGFGLVIRPGAVTVVDNNGSDARALFRILLPSQETAMVPLRLLAVAGHP